MTTRKYIKKPAAKRVRTAAQIASEHLREKTSEKTLVRHNEESAKALQKLRGRFDESDPEIMRIALVELANSKGRNR